MANLSLSIIVPTYQGAHRLKGLLDDLSKQSNRDFELIVSIDGSTDGSLELMEQERRFERFTIVNEPNGGRAQARNRGAKASTGDVLLFLDDDMRLLTHCVSQHIAFHSLHPNCAYAPSVAVYSQPEPNVFLRYQEFLAKKFSNNSGRVTRLDKDHFELSSQNFSIRKSLFLSVHGFDEELTDSEDFDLCYRLSLNEEDLFADPSVVAFHNPDYRSLIPYVARQREYRQAREKLLSNRPGLSQRTPQAAALPLYKWIVYRLFATPTVLKFLDSISALKLTESFDAILFEIFSVANHSWSCIFYHKAMPQNSCNRELP